MSYRLTATDVRRMLNARGSSAKCPAHEDKSASLSINEGDDGKVLLHCHAGCTPAEVCDAAGIKLAQLMGSGDARAAQTKERTHHPSRQKAIDAARYGARMAAKDESINVATVYDYGPDIAVARMTNKDFRPVYRNRQGWLVGKPAAYPLYRLAEFSDPGESFIFFAEGEKDVDNLIDAGVIATTMAGGVNGIVRNLKTADISPLSGRDVVLLPDNDKPGRECMQQVAAILNDVASTVRILELPDLPDKGDASDWLDAGGDGEELCKLAQVISPHIAAPSSDKVEKSKGRRLIMRRGSSIDDGGNRYLWRRRIPLGGPTIIFSRPGAGKSTIAADLAAHVTTGTPWPDGAPCEQGHVIYIKGEGTDASIRDRMKNAGADQARYDITGRADVDDASDESPMIDLAGDDANLLAHEIRMIGDVKLVIVDTLDSLYPSMRMIDNGHIRKCLWPMQELAEQIDIALVILAHTNKGGYADPLDRLSGGRAIGGAARAVWYLGQQDRESDDYFMAPVKVNDFRPEPAIGYQVVGIGPDTPGAIRWGEVDSDLSAWDLDQPPKTEPRSKTEDCVEWMRERLADGPELIDAFKVAAKDAGFGEHCYKAARRELGIETRAAKGSVPPRYWACLPGQTPMTPDHLILDSEQLSNGGVVKGSSTETADHPTLAGAAP